MLSFLILPAMPLNPHHALTMGAHSQASATLASVLTCLAELQFVPTTEWLATYYTVCVRCFHVAHGCPKSLIGIFLTTLPLALSLRVCACENLSGTYTDACFAGALQRQCARTAVGQTAVADEHEPCKICQHPGTRLCPLCPLVCNELSNFKFCLKKKNFLYFKTLNHTLGLFSLFFSAWQAQRQSKIPLPTSLVDLLAEEATAR